MNTVLQPKRIVPAVLVALVAVFALGLMLAIAGAADWLFYAVGIAVGGLALAWIFAPGTEHRGHGESGVGVFSSQRKRRSPLA